MTATPRLGLLALLALAPLAVGCGGSVGDSGESPASKIAPVIVDSPVKSTSAITPDAGVVAPDTQPPGEGATGPSGLPPTSTDPTAEPSPTTNSPGAAAAEPAAAPRDLRAEAGTTPAAGADGVALEAVGYDALRSRIAEKGARLTMMDAWATWCAPCKENFPHVVEMHRKYGDRGLNVVSLSLDDPTDADALAEARRFLREQGATFSNFVLDEPQDEAFEHLDINGIPAVFLFGPDGKEIRRFTMDDPKNQFTYEQVERAVASLLEGPSPAEGSGAGSE